MPILRGLSGERLRVCGQIEAAVEFCGRIRKINFAPCTLILGRNFIRLFSVVLYVKGARPQKEHRKKLC